MTQCLNFRSFIFSFVCELLNNTLSITDHTPLNDTVTESWSWQDFGAIQAWELVMAQFQCYPALFWNNLETSNMSGDSHCSS